MSQLVLFRTAPGKLCLFFQQDARQISKAFQETPGVWGPQRIDTITGGGGSPAGLIDKTIAVGDNGSVPVFGVLLTSGLIRIETFTGTFAVATGPSFAQTDLPAPAGVTPNRLTLGSGGHMMVAAGNAVFAAQNSAPFTAASWQRLTLPAGATVTGLAMATSGLTGVPEAFIATQTGVLHSTRSAAGVWAPFQQLGRALSATAMVAVPNGSNLVDVVIVSNAAIFHAHQHQTATGPAFLDWNQLPASGQPTQPRSIAVARVSGAGTLPLLTVFANDAAGNVSTAQQSSPDSNQWNAWRALPVPPPGLGIDELAVAAGATQLVDVVGIGGGRLLDSQQSIPNFVPWRLFPTS